MKVLVIFGAGTRLLEPLVCDYSDFGKVIRIYHSKKPTFRDNCIDIGILADLEEAIGELEIQYGNLEIDFVGAAAVYQNQLFVSMELDYVTQILDTCVYDYVYVTRVLLRQMLRSRYGRLVFLSSFRSVHISTGTSLYSASKAFGETFFSAIGKEYGRRGIFSAVIRMGYFDGGMLDTLETQLNGAEPVSLRTSRVGSSYELCSAIKFAFENPMVNGGSLELDGGLIFE